jgi:hypothetical protein
VVIAALRDRSEPIEMRLLWVGAFCRDFDAASVADDISLALDNLAGKTAKDIPTHAKSNVPAKIQLVWIGIQKISKRITC